MRFDDPEHGIASARAGLIFGVAASIAGNVANAILTASTFSLGWRIPGAVFWPLALFCGIEVMVRNRHRRGALAMLGRVMLLSAGVTTFVTSYVNLNGFMVKMGEPWLATVAGPIGVDGLMLGCTVMLLAATLKAPQPTQPALVAQYNLPAVQQEDRDTDADLWARITGDFAGSDAPVSPAPVSAPPAIPVVPGGLPQRVRKERPASDAQERALSMLLEGLSIAHTVSATEVSRPTVQRIATALAAIKADRQADVSAQRLRPALVDMIRRAVTR